ncbi:MAG TPA: carboxylesterase family protein [Kofleriaceae bacterium]|nr:carboxylesterase family protein [Kofleriaceae bacterium]
MRTRVRAMCVLALAAPACGGGGAGALDAGVDGAPPCVPVAGAAAERVTTTGGVVHGAQDGDTWAYEGIPYIQPVSGGGRFQAPAPAACSATELDATHLGSRCPQLDDSGAFVGDEDCAQLNLWAPSAAAAPRPVMVWFHGGGNAQGSATDPLYDGRRLAVAGDVVVVTANYRLGQLGFLADVALAGGGQVGNYGLLDQIAVLRWVHDNVAAFGGDPANVTIFGESAGGRDVCTLLATPASAGLFARAMIESGACKFLDTPAAAQATADEVAAAVGCAGAADRAACLRAAPVEALTRAAAAPVSALDSSKFGPVVDGEVLPEQPEAAIIAGRHHPVPLAIGANADETGREVPVGLTEPQYDAQVRAQFGAIADQVLAHYPPMPTPRLAYVRLTTDARFVCPSRQIARHADAAQTAPVFRYFFQYAPTPVGAVHGLDVPYVFGTFDAVLVNGQPYTPTATDLALSAAVQGYWTRFARGGDPGGTPAWPAQAAGDPVLVLDRDVTTASGVRGADCDFWAPYYDAL